MCRYATVPVLMANSTAARNFTMLAVTKPSDIKRMKQKIAQEPYIKNFSQIELPLPQSKEDIKNDDFLKLMFARWVTEHRNFEELKHAYKEVLRQNNYDNIPAYGQVVLINPTNLTAVNEILGDRLFNVTLEEQKLQVIVSKMVKYAMFQGWENKGQLVRLVFAYSKDLGLPAFAYRKDGTRYVIRPPPPPKKGKFDNGYEYVPHKHCKYHDLFQNDEVTETDSSTDDMLDFIRTAASFAIITIFIMAMGFFFSVYTFLNPRYMFKRLAAGIHFISASTSVVSIQTLASSIEFAKEHVLFTFPHGAKYTFGYGYYLAWFVFAFNVFACITFLWYSKKKKGSKAATEELGMADEAINIGR